MRDIKYIWQRYAKDQYPGKSTNYDCNNTSPRWFDFPHVLWKRKYSEIEKYRVSGKVFYYNGDSKIIIPSCECCFFLRTDIREESYYRSLFFGIDDGDVVTIYTCTCKLIKFLNEQNKTRINYQIVKGCDIQDLLKLHKIHNQCPLQDYHHKYSAIRSDK